MGTAPLHLGTVTFSLVLLVVIPFVPITFLLFRGQQWPKIIFSAMVLGCSLQASVGMLWSHIPVALPLGEVAVLALAWLALIGWAFGSARKRNIVVWNIDDEPIHPGLIIILILGFAIRSIHPLEVDFLGQSDAYTHLNYIRNIIDLGLLSNPVYPPGFHWILALPSLIFSIEPYYTARFGGVFFGTGLVLGIYVLLEQCVDRRTALFASFCAAAFPGMTLLMKTGVGVFANQFGLMLLPAVFMFYILSISARGWKSNEYLLLAISCCGLAAAVPMMLFHVLLVFSLERLVMLIRNRREWLVKTLHVAILLLPALFLFTFHVSQIGGGQRFRTTEMITSHNEGKISTIHKIAEKAERKIASSNSQAGKISKLIVKSPYFKLLADYFSIKREGFGNTKLDLLAVTLAGGFFLLLIIGLVREGTTYIILGFWGLLTCLQASTGLLQFSSYQREGWSLLVATCCLSGILASFAYQYGQRSGLFRLSVFAAMAVSVVWCVIHPPIHFPTWSSAENDLVQTIRYLGKQISVSPEYCKDKEKTVALCSITNKLEHDLEVVLVTRRYVGWGNQGEIALNVLPQDSALTVLIVDSKLKHDIFQPGRQYVALLDSRNRLSGQQMISAFAMVTPSMVEATMKSRERMFGLNENIVKQLDSLPATGWQVTHIEISDRLSAYVAVPLD